MLWGDNSFESSENIPIGNREYSKAQKRHAHWAFYQSAKYL